MKLASQLAPAPCLLCLYSPCLCESRGLIGRALGQTVLTVAACQASSPTKGEAVVKAAGALKKTLKVEA